ncbi:MAG: adenylyltransferase/cytidyltransferase family protein [Phycisphaeraceae bacterium]|nr:adenylyltransferase/cytidyltransferase family protein [Phycisphaeraceae bacterium]
MGKTRTRLTLVGAEVPAVALEGAAAGEPLCPTAAEEKVLSKERLLRLRDRARREGKRVVQCHGCFDIVHPGHLRHLRHAKTQGDVLLVTITGDGEIHKGDGRPLIPQELRAENLAALDCVDWVYVEPRPTAAELLEEVQPDVYVKGKEYEQNNDPRFASEKNAVIRHGGKVVFSSGDVIFSSTALIAALERSVDPYHARLRELLERPDLSAGALADLSARFRGKRFVVVGEVIRDTYVLCDRPDVAGESPIMTLRPVDRRGYDGGAAIIARHLSSLGASAVLVTALPRGDEGDELRRRLLAEGVRVVSVEAGVRLAEKQRFLVGGQKVMKLDLVDRYELDETTSRALEGLALEAAGEGGGGCDGAIVADFGLGLWSGAMLERLCPALRKRVGVLAGDVSGRRSHLRSMRGMDLLCPSESELREAYHLFDEGLGLLAYQLLSETNSRHALVTMGPEGLIAFDRLPGAEGKKRAAVGGAGAANGGDDAAWRTRLKAEHVPALASHAVDPLGCGDAMLATAALALSVGAPLTACALLASAAAAVQVQRLGNTVVSAADLRGHVSRLHGAHLAYTPPEVAQSRTGRLSAVTRSAGVGAIGAMGV